jgi:hypothetical protein
MRAKGAILAACLLVGLAGACGARRLEPTVSSPFTEADAGPFDGAADLLGVPGDLPGGWRVRWEEHLRLRAERSDVIAVVALPAARIDSTPERVTTYRLLARVERILKGEAFETLELPLREGDPGWATVEGREDRILDGRFIAYVKWYRPSEDEPVRARWHLSPASEDVLQETEAAIAALED